MKFSCASRTCFWPFPNGGRHCSGRDHGPGRPQPCLCHQQCVLDKYARLARGIALTSREALYVKSARLSGVSSLMIIVRHILPTVRPAMTVLATVGMAKGILAVSALGFLGFGVQPPDPEWGTLLMEGKDYLFTAPHLSIFPGLSIMAVVMAFNLMGNQREQ